MSQFHFSPIGFVESCFKQKFGIPRQSGLAPDARGAIRLVPPYDNPETLVGLEGCSHIWVLFVFHRKPGAGWKPRIKAPRLGGNRTMGVFASRSPNRPNPIGMSVLPLLGLNLRDGVRLEVAGLDLLDGTPVLDIKPYLPYVDRIEDAVFALAEQPPGLLPVRFCPAAEVACEAYLRSTGFDLRQLLMQVLAQNPIPQYQRAASGRIYATIIRDAEVRWKLLSSEQGELIEVHSVMAVETE